PGGRYVRRYQPPVPPSACTLWSSPTCGSLPGSRSAHCRRHAFSTANARCATLGGLHRTVVADRDGGGHDRDGREPLAGPEQRAPLTGAGAAGDPVVLLVE